jgi:hypothetical protein
MPLDTSIILSGRLPEGAERFARGRQQAMSQQLSEQRLQQGQQQQQLTDLQIANQKVQNLSTREKSRLESSILGLGQVKAFLDAGDTQGAESYLTRRRQELGQQIAQGFDVDTAETDQALEMLRSNPEQLGKLADAGVQFGYQSGILQRPTFASQGGATGVLLNRIQDDVEANTGKRPTLEEAILIQKGLTTGRADVEGDIAYRKRYSQGQADIQTKPKIEEGKKEVERVADLKAKLPKAQNALTSTLAKYSSVKDTIQRAFPLVQSLNASFGSESLAKVPGSGAADLRALLDTIGANLAFNELGEMRSNSPTGGALGQVTERELALLQATKQNITATQSVGQLRENLLRLYKDLEAGEGRLQDAFGNEFGELTQPQGGAKDEFQDLGNGIKIRFK